MQKVFQGLGFALRSEPGSGIVTATIQVVSAGMK
jgi:hypothetical protein